MRETRGKQGRGNPLVRDRSLRFITGTLLLAAGAIHATMRGTGAARSFDLLSQSRSRSVQAHSDIAGSNAQRLRHRTHVGSLQIDLSDQVCVFRLEDRHKFLDTFANDSFRRRIGSLVGV